MRRRKDSKAVLVIMGTIFMIIGFMIIFGGIIVKINNDEFYKNAKSTSAQIVEIETHRESSYRKGKHRTKVNHDVYVSYEVNGELYDHVLINGYTSSMDEGDIITIYYNERNPGNIRVKSIDSIGQYIFYIMGIVFAGIGGSILLVPIFKAKKRKRIIENGIKVNGNVIDVRTNRNLKVNGVNPFIVEVEIVNPYTGEMQRYVDKKVFENINDYRINEVDVYIIPDKPKEYYIDIKEAIEEAKRNNSYGDSTI